MSHDQLHTVVVDTKQDGKTTFRIPIYMELVKKVGSGAYGCVASFRDKRTDEKLAVKKITNAFNDLVDGKRILREVKLLRTFDHDNIIRIQDMYPPSSPDFEDIYIVTDLMETDLHRVIYSKQPLTEEHHQFFIHQLLRGLNILAQRAHRAPRSQAVQLAGQQELRPEDLRLRAGAGLDRQGRGYSRAHRLRCHPLVQSTGGRLVGLGVHGGHRRLGGRLHSL
eukprot:SRR837773.3703.p1 GENE.SRR837773.3703~~SRR837773.3703.p1  ORF type:complete len:223 (+),score=22.89 SRR837773.3703:75-743(+)